MNIYLRTFVYSVAGFILFAALIFWPAGTFDYWQAWAFLAVMAAVSIPYTVYLVTKAPDVLRRRIRSGPVAEARTIQKLAVGMLQLCFFAMLIVGGLDRRFGWSQMPTWLCVVGIVLTAAGLILAIWVVVQNSWAAATITIEAGQELVSTGLYGVVRHPMYSGALLMALAMPLGLGSYWALIAGLLAAVSLVVRILDEEVLLHDELAGYGEYARQVRYRMLPGLW